MAKYIPKSIGTPYNLKQPLPVSSFKIDWNEVGEIVEIINRNFIRGDFSVSYRQINGDLKRQYGALEVQEALSKFKAVGWKVDRYIDNGGIAYYSFHFAI